MDTVANNARIAPATLPFPADVQAALDRTMPPGQPPLLLFTTLARDPRLFAKFFGAGLLERGHLTLRQRELVIHRTTALCGSAYEWGVHVAIFAARVGFDAVQLASLAHGTPDDACWSDDDACLLRLCDALHLTCTIDDALWQSLSSRFADEAMLELLMLGGFYRTVSYLTNALRLPPEPGTRGFP
jgi:alkylhydroperoxidase family enzyme